MQQNILLVFILGLSHAVADGAAGWLLASLPLDLVEIGGLFLLYNICAFALQPLAGWLTDYLRTPKMAAAMGLSLITIALLMPITSVFTIILLGTGSAFFHVGGGGLALCLTPNKAVGPGIFAAPGVLGLGLGGFLAVIGYNIVWPLFFLLVALISIIVGFPLTLSIEKPKQEKGAILDSHDIVMMVMLAAIALRSAIWTSLQFVYKGDFEILLHLAIAACAGKMIGGIAADYLGWRNWVFTALTAASIFLSFPDSKACLLWGVAFLQSSTPVFAVALSQSMPRLPATSAGLAFGLAIAAGGIPHYLEWSSYLASPTMIAILITIIFCILWKPLKEPDAIEITH